MMQPASLMALLAAALLTTAFAAAPPPRNAIWRVVVEAVARSTSAVLCILVFVIVTDEEISRDENYKWRELRYPLSNSTKSAQN